MNETHSKAGLSVWHLTMLALGSVVGGSFFFGSSVAIQAAGPAVLIAYIIGGFIVYCILSALSEMTVANPEPGSFRTYTEQAFGGGAGFTVGWVYWTGLVLSMSSESIAASTLLRGYIPELPVPLVGTAIIVSVTLVNLLGASLIGRLESVLTVVKLGAVIGFIVLAVILISSLVTGNFGRLAAANPLDEGMRTLLGGGSWFVAGIRGFAGSMLMVMFTYAGFEVLGLASSEAQNASRTVPQAIRITVFLLVGLYITAMTSLLLLIPSTRLSRSESPFVTALSLHGFNWAGFILNIVLITAILSTMLASLFGLGRMLRSLADEGHAPAWMKDKTDVPRRGILISGVAMLLGLGLGLLLPQNVYLFLVGSGGFSLLFAYVMIIASHYWLRKKAGKPLSDSYRLKGFPTISYMGIVGLLAIMACMPFVAGQGTGLLAGLLFVAIFGGIYALMKRRKHNNARVHDAVPPEQQELPRRSKLAMEAADELEVEGAFEDQSLKQKEQRDT